MIETLERSHQQTLVQKREQGPCCPLPGPALGDTLPQGQAPALGPSSAHAAPRGAPARGLPVPAGGPCPAPAAPLQGRGLKMAEAAALPWLLPRPAQHCAALTAQPASRTRTPRPTDTSPPASSSWPRQAPPPPPPPPPHHPRPPAIFPPPPPPAAHAPRASAHAHYSRARGRGRRA